MITTSSSLKPNDVYRKVKKTLEKKLSFSIPPNIISRINKTLTSDVADLKELAREIENYPSFAIKLLKIANSPLFGFPKKVSTIYHALLVIGLKGVRLLILNLFTTEFLKKNREIFLHSFRTSFCCKWLNEKFEFNLKDLELEEVSLAGLIHDFGKILLELTFETEYSKVRRKISEERKRCKNNIIQLEKETFGIDHAELGAKLIEEWNFPDILVYLVAKHHQPLTKKSEEKLRQKLLLLFLGDFISNFYSDYDKDCIEDLILLPEVKNILNTLKPEHSKYFRKGNFYELLHEFNIYVLNSSLSNFP